MAADPEPDDGVAIDNRKRAVVEPDAGGEDRPNRAHPLEAEARVTRVSLEATVSFTRVALNVLGKAPKGFAEPPSCPGNQRASGSSTSVRPCRCS